MLKITAISDEIKLADIFPKSSVLIVFPDNVLEHESSWSDCEDEPKLRRYNKHGAYADHPKTAGIPIAWTPWKPDIDYFEELSQDVKFHINRSLEEIREILEKHKDITEVAYISNKTGIFGTKGNVEIREYITRRLKSLIP